MQHEPSFQMPVDTAGPLRIRGALGLVRLRARDVLTVLADHLGDPVPIVQGAAARALCAHGDPAGGALARLRVHLGVDEGDVLTDCLCAVLGLDPDGLAFVRERLLGPDELASRAAALALGEMRPEGAFPLLRAFHQDAAGEDRAIAATALGLLRSDEAREYLESLEAD